MKPMKNKLFFSGHRKDPDICFVPTQNPMLSSNSSQSICHSRRRDGNQGPLSSWLKDYLHLAFFPSFNHHPTAVTAEGELGGKSHRNGTAQRPAELGPELLPIPRDNNKNCFLFFPEYIFSFVL